MKCRISAFLLLSTFLWIGLFRVPKTLNIKARPNTRPFPVGKWVWLALKGEKDTQSLQGDPSAILSFNWAAGLQSPVEDWRPPSVQQKDNGRRIKLRFRSKKKSLGGGWIISNKILQTDLYRKEIFLRAGISPIFKPKIGKIRCHDEFLLRFFFTLYWSLNLLINVFPFKTWLQLSLRVSVCAAIE